MTCVTVDKITLHSLQCFLYYALKNCVIVILSKKGYVKRRNVLEVNHYCSGNTLVYTCYIFKINTTISKIAMYKNNRYNFKINTTISKILMYKNNQSHKKQCKYMK